MVAIVIYVLIAIVALVIQAALARLLLERAASTEDVRKLAKDAYSQQLVPKDLPSWSRPFDKRGWLSFHGGEAVGASETFLIYTALCIFKKDAALIIAAYLAFKVASKWDVWAHVYKLPDKIDGKTDDEWRIFRAALGGFLFTRFVTGTIISLLVASLAAIAFLRFS